MQYHSYHKLQFDEMMVIYFSTTPTFLAIFV